MGGEEIGNVDENEVNAVTWGVFRGKEIIQPTVVDHQAFSLWKNTAFDAWTSTWAQIYKPQKDYDGDEESVRFLE